MTLVLIGKGLVLGGEPSKIGVIGALGIYIYINVYIYMTHDILIAYPSSHSKKRPSTNFSFNHRLLESPFAGKGIG